MKIIRTDRGKGKTTALIQQADRDGNYILCFSKQNASYIYNRAIEMGLRIPFPITVADLPIRNSRPILIDEVDLVLPQIIGSKVDTITTSASIDTLEPKEDIKIELKLEIENIDETKQQITELWEMLSSLKVNAIQ